MEIKSNNFYIPIATIKSAKCSFRVDLTDTVAEIFLILV
jgi:hypothetical protein